MPHLPAHPVWLWLVLASPVLPWLVLWIVANRLNISVKPLSPWAFGGSVLFFIPYVLLDQIAGRKSLSLAFGAISYSCWSAMVFIQRRYMFETLPAAGNKWYLPWRAARISIPSTMRILVRDIDSVSPWYVEKLGLRKLSVNPHGETDIATLRFKEDGNSVILTTRGGFQTGKTPILFTKRIGKVRDVMAARGVNVGTIKRDRQGIRYFQIHDPEGNEIEVVEDR